MITYECKKTKAKELIDKIAGKAKDVFRFAW
jgi:hypothetical protein